MPDIFTQFADNLIEEAGLKNADEEKHERYRESILALITNRLGIELTQYLDGDALNAFADIMEKNPEPREYYDFLKSHIDDFDQKVVGVLMKIKQEFLMDLAGFDENV